MLKLEIGRCCTTCEKLRIENEDAGKDMKIGCIHRAVCSKYLNEPLQALPVEALFKE